MRQRPLAGTAPDRCQARWQRIAPCCGLATSQDRATERDYHRTFPLQGPTLL